MNSVSVIIPCFNDGPYIMEAIESVRAQTYPDTELIIIDDGSTDPATKQILEELEESDIKLLHTDHIGPAAARNRGISFATGRYILPLDADDKIEPTYLEKAVAVLENNPKVGVVYCYAELFGKKKGRWDLPDYTFSRMLVDNIVFVTAVFYRADWEAVGGFCEELIYGLEDYDFWLSILELGRDIYQIPEVLFQYRIKKRSRTTRLTESRQKLQATYEAIFERHKSLYKKNYDIVIPTLRNMWMDQIFKWKSIEKVFFFIKYIKEIPLVKRIAQWLIRKT